jgi:hypothetical protein
MNVREVVGAAVGGIFLIVASSYVTAGVHDWWLRGDQEIELKAREAVLNDPSPALDYGSPGTVYFKYLQYDEKPEGPLSFPSSGASVWICFDDLTWYRPIPMELQVWFIDEMDRISNYDDKIALHDIHIPPKMGPYGKKCRSWTLPGGLGTGSWTMAGLASPKDRAYKSTPVPFPRIKFMVQ